MVKAVALLSAGLDSLLSARIVRDQGVEVLGLHCTFGFGFTGGPDRMKALEGLLRRMDVPFQTLDITEPFMDVMRNPAHGFGSGVNPCIDCHLFMLKEAKKRMEAVGAEFVVTGEVVGQRPMSQHKPTLFHIEKSAGLKRLILRPLSAKILPVTIPEEMGWVDRERLFGISGRGRKEQEALAKRFGIGEYFQPAGGCILTDPFYAKRIKAFIRYRGQNALTSDVMKLCRYGRHFWIDGRVWVVVGRDEEDNASIEKLASGKWRLEAADYEGPTVLADGQAGSRDVVGIAASILARYVNKRRESEIRVHYAGSGEQGTILAAPAEEPFLKKWQI
jgi:tRNA-specific 2-thiouridylase